MKLRLPVRTETGHTLIELLVAMIIGLALVLGAFQVMATFEGHKRTTTALNDSLQSGNYGLWQLDVLSRSAGTGITQMDKYATGCPLNYVSSDASKTVSNGAIGALPVPFDTMFTTPTALKLRLAP